MLNDDTRLHEILINSAEKEKGFRDIKLSKQIAHKGV